MKQTALFILLCVNLMLAAAPEQDIFELDVPADLKGTERIDYLIAKAEHYNLNDFFKAHEYAVAALTLAEKNNNAKLKAKAHEILAYIKLGLNRRDNAWEHFNSAARLLQQTGQNEDIARSHFLMGYGYSHLNTGSNQACFNDRVARAFEHYKQAVDLYMEIIRTNPSHESKKDIHRYYTNLASFTICKSASEAMGLIEQGVAAEIELGGNKYHLAKLYKQLGVFQFTNDQLKEAIKSLQLAYDMAKDETNDDRLIYHITYTLGRAYLMTNAKQSATRYLDKARKYALMLGVDEITGAGNLLATYDDPSKKRQLGNTTAVGNAVNALPALQQNPAKAFNVPVFFDDAFDDPVTDSRERLEILRLRFENDMARKERYFKEKRLKNQVRTLIGLLSVIVIGTIAFLGFFGNRLTKVRMERKNLRENLSSMERELSSKSLHVVELNNLLKTVLSRIDNISEEFPNRKKLSDLRNEIEHNQNQDKWTEFEYYFDKDFHKLLTDRFPKLTPNDKKLCSLLRHGLSTKEIMAITHKNYKAIEVSRTRLRKKLNITNTNKDLSTFLASLS